MVVSTSDLTEKDGFKCFFRSPREEKSSSRVFTSKYYLLLIYLYKLIKTTQSLDKHFSFKIAFCQLFYLITLIPEYDCCNKNAITKLKFVSAQEVDAGKKLLPKSRLSEIIVEYPLKELFMGKEHENEQDPYWTDDQILAEDVHVERSQHIVKIPIALHI